VARTHDHSYFSLFAAIVNTVELFIMSRDESVRNQSRCVSICLDAVFGETAANGAPYTWRQHPNVTGLLRRNGMLAI
jgi:hypothetical protein